MSGIRYRELYIGDDRQRGVLFGFFAQCWTSRRPRTTNALELNDIYHALKRTGMLVRWTPESNIRSRNDLTHIGYVKDYDATIAVRLGHK